MAENRSALIVAVSEYQDAGLRQLVAPAQDAEALARVLGDPAIGGFAVKTLLNQPSHQINREIEAFFANRAKEDLLLLYFSGHGVKDEEGRLYFATTDTDRKFLRTTAVAATLINDVMHYCRSRRQVLILDCCYSGAFARGMTYRADEAVGAGEYFREGRGQFVLTASDALQYAFEGDDVSGEGVRSVFTHTLVRGLETGEADLDGDGAISCDELYDYLHGCVTDRMPQQKPRKWAFAVEGEIMIARNPRQVVKPTALPAELRQSIEDPLPWVREGAARHLGDLLQHGNSGLVAAAHAALRQMAEDDSLKVRTVVAELLKSHADEKPLATELKESVIAFPEKAKAQPISPAILREEPTATLPKKAEAQLALPPMEYIHGWPAQQVQTLQQQTAQALGLAVEFSDRLKDGSQGPLMMVIPGGRFLMGSPEDETGRNSEVERRHEVEVKPFAIGKYAVSFEEYDHFAMVTGREKPADKGWGRGRRPVINVSWFDAVAYTEWLSWQSGQTYRLPTEAEWEYACRAGTPTAYYFGASVQLKLANYSKKTDVVIKGGFIRTLLGAEEYQYEGEHKTVAVGHYPANAWRLHDMHGNVLEWTGSEYDAGYGGAELRGSSDPNSSAERVVRGGAWLFDSMVARSANRGRSAPDGTCGYLGFRLARGL